MAAERQPGKPYQRLLFSEPEEGLRHDHSGKGGTRPGRPEEPQAATASQPARALTERLLEKVCHPDNLNRAYQRVKANKGAPGVDGMTINELRYWIAEHKQKLVGSLLDVAYEPQPVRGVEIPKPGGGVRQLGIPTVIDRLVQQALLQVLEPLLDPTFSPSSFGFRPGRGAHHALPRRGSMWRKGVSSWWT